MSRLRLVTMGKLNKFSVRNMMGRFINRVNCEVRGLMSNHVVKYQYNIKIEEKVR